MISRIGMPIRYVSFGTQAAEFYKTMRDGGKFVIPVTTRPSIPAVWKTKSEGKRYSVIFPVEGTWDHLIDDLTELGPTGNALISASATLRTHGWELVSPRFLFLHFV